MVQTPPPTQADPLSVQVAAMEMSDEFLACRELGHTWHPRTAAWNGDERVYDRTLRCPRCKTMRLQTLSQRGEVLTNSYAYPEGYLLTIGGRIAGAGRDMLRLESLNRQIGEH